MMVFYTLDDPKNDHFDSSFLSTVPTGPKPLYTWMLIRTTYFDPRDGRRMYLWKVSNIAHMSSVQRPKKQLNISNGWPWKPKMSHWVNFKLVKFKVWRLFQISVPLSCLPKYSDNDVPGSTYAQIDSSVPEATKCYHEMQFFDEGAQWRSKQNPCTMCNCHQNLVKCDSIPCPPLTCSSRTAPGECCPSCTSKSLQSS
jgi:hypothetical protein